MNKALPEGDSAENKDGCADVEVHRFGHWACGWFEIVLIRPDSDAHIKALEIQSKLEDYPILSENDFSNEEDAEAQLTWRECYSNTGRVVYIREHRSQFEFRSFAEMLACVRGKFFAGYASEMCAP